MAPLTCNTFEEQLEHVLKSLHEGTYSYTPEGVYLSAMLIRIQSHDLSRQMAAEYVYPPSGATLVTALAFEKQEGWRQGTSRLRQLAEAGVDTNVPDAMGRVGSLQGLVHQAILFNTRTLDWAVQHGANATVTDLTPKGPRSWLSLNFGEALTGGGTKHTPEFWQVVQTKVNTALRKIAKHHPDELGPTLERLAAAPVQPVHAAWFASIKARYLGNALDKAATRKAAPRPRL